MSLLKNTIFFFLIISILFFIASCSKDDIEDVVVDNALELISNHKIDIPEPSGLAIDKTGTILYTVSDNTGNIYKISTQGDVLKSYILGGDDLEGISSFTTNKLLIAEERTKQIVEYSISNANVIRHKIHYDNTDENSGIEGIAYKDNDGTTFILNEKDPGKLLRLRADFSIISEYDLNFASDYSGIFYDSYTNNLWILSDQSKSLNRCTLQGDLIKKYSLRVNQAEGVAVTKDEIYIVSDIEAKLYVYKKPEL